MNLKAISLTLLIFPPAIRADVGVNRFFAVKNNLVLNHCTITKDGGETIEIDAIQGVLASCGKRCSSIVSFRAVP